MMNPKSEVIDGPLCCCEYENINGDKSHVLAALCDCEDVDSACDRIDSCVGEANHRSFLLSIILFVVGGVWGIVLSLQSVCHHPQYGFHVPQCLYAYRKNSSAIVLSCSLYSALACLAMLILLLQQFHLITHNWTYRERKLALRGHLPKDLMYDYDKGFLQNWKNFLLKRFDQDLITV
ncbi:palmitoyltransferase ZDHHC23-like [Anneissia japonica]|uniref:palmitoyltransferase ZDHHC23-like n=1 Tax=Anneissia japonica TaxID=1529436 RepID=UPI00142598F1|nr:palmitoyltransferase ZDHHC23-like [Anneissia japonica]